MRITLDVPLWQAWVQGGGQLENMRVSNEARHQLIVTGDPARIKGIPLHANERSLCHVRFNFLARELSGQTAFDYDVLQTATDGRTIGGERYHLILPGRPGFYADAGGNKNISPNNSADLNAYSINEPAIYNWYDPEGNLLETGTSLTVSPAISTKYKLEVIAESDGVKDYDEVEVKIKEHEITGVSPNPTTGTTVVGYRLTNATSAYIMLSRPYSNVNNQYILDVSNTQIQLNVDQLLPGTYSLVLVVNGQQTDAGTVTIL